MQPAVPAMCEPGEEACTREDEKWRSPLLQALVSGSVATATSLLRTRQADALNNPRLSILEDVFPLALTTIAELYDKYGVTGREKPYFDFARELWSLMPDHERQIPDMLCTFLYAGCKFNQIEFVAWVLPIVKQHAAINLVSLMCDRTYEFNQLRHSALYYVCMNGSSQLYDMFVDACGGISPFMFEATMYARVY
ncbi:hypothetical protein EON68_01350, partial [archaeon]